MITYPIIFFGLGELVFLSKDFERFATGAFPFYDRDSCVAWNFRDIRQYVEESGCNVIQTSGNQRYAVIWNMGGYDSGQASIEHTGQYFFGIVYQHHYADSGSNFITQTGTHYPVSQLYYEASGSTAISDPTGYYDRIKHQSYYDSGTNYINEDGWSFFIAQQYIAESAAHTIDLNGYYYKYVIYNTDYIASFINEEGFYASPPVYSYTESGNVNVVNSGAYYGSWTYSNNNYESGQNSITHTGYVYTPEVKHLSYQEQCFIDIWMTGSYYRDVFYDAMTIFNDEFKIDQMRVDNVMKFFDMTEE